MIDILKYDRNGDPIREGSEVEYQYPNSKMNQTGIIEWDAEACRFRLRVTQEHPYRTKNRFSNKTESVPPPHYVKMQLA